MERKEEIETIAAWLNNPQVSIAGITHANTVGIQGLGGVGKSTLAAYFYHSLDFAAKFWADVSSKPDFTIFAEKIIIALGGKVSRPIDITELTNNLLHLLNQRRCLLVVDNLETLLNTERNWQDKYYQQFFNRWLQQGTCSTLLITTQDKPQLFKGLQHWYPLGGMKKKEGVNLLKQFNIIGTNQELEEFVEYVQGHPLTIKLVAGFLINDCDRKLNQIKELELEQFELAYQEASGLHRNKQDARLAWIIQQHLDRLTDEQTNFLVNLSVYRLPFNREAASYMWREPEVKPIVIQREVQQLCDLSLLTRTETNSYQFESLVKKFILQQDVELTNAHMQAIRYYQANLKPKESWQVLADVGEYLEIIDHWCELKQYNLANNILDFCFNFLNLQGYYEILAEVYGKLILGWQDNLQLEERSDYAWALNHLGVFKRILGNVKQSIFYYKKSLEIYEQIECFYGQTASFNNIGNALHSLGEYQKAIDFYKQSLKNAQYISDCRGEASSFGNIGNVYYSLGEYQLAIDFHKQSLSIQKQISNHHGEANSLNHLGVAYNSLGEYQLAIDFHQQSLAIKRRIGDCRGEADSLGSLGNAYNSLGEYQKSIDFHQQSLKIAQQIGDRSGEANSLGNLGNAYNSLGEYQKSINFYQQSLTIKRQIGDCRGEADSLNNLGVAYNFLEEYRLAINFHRQSLSVRQQIGDLYGIASSLSNLGVAYRSLKKYQLAIDLQQQSLSIQQRIGDRRGEADSLNNLGIIYNSLGEYQLAIGFYQQSLYIQEQIKNCHGEANSWFNLGIVYVNLQQSLEAKTNFEKAQRIYNAIGLNSKVEQCKTQIQNIDNNLK